MFRRTLPLVCLFSMAVPVLAQQPLSNDEITRAIKAGEDRRYAHMLSKCVATAGFGDSLASSQTRPYDVTVSGTAGRLAALAAEGKRLYKPLTLGSITPEMTAPALHVVAVPYAPTRSGSRMTTAAPIQSIVLKLKDGDAVLQPVSFATDPVEWKNLLGATIDGTIGRATFSAAEFAALPAGDVRQGRPRHARGARCSDGASVEGA